MSKTKSTTAQGRENRAAVSAFVVLAVSFFSVLQLCAADEAEGDFELEIYLPRQVTIKGDTPSLGQISIIKGRRPLAAKAGEVALGRFAVLGQELVIDRPTILGRLASNGIDASKVTLTGAEKVTIKQNLRTIKGSEFVREALSFLERSLPSGLICQTRPIRMPRDLTISRATGSIELSSSLIPCAGKRQVKVKVAVLVDGKVAGTREAAFRLKYHCRRAVTKVDIPAGAVITTENTRIEKLLSDSPEPAGWTEPYGLVARRRLIAKTTLRPGLLGTRKSPVVVQRSQAVMIRVERPGLLVTAVGRAMKQGRSGEYIKVRNIDSQRIIVVRVNEDGTVEPVF